MTILSGAIGPAGPVGVRACYLPMTDPLVEPMLRDLTWEYRSRYGEDGAAEIVRYPAADFAPPNGALVVLLAGGRAVAGGAFRGHDEKTVELKRIWTHSAYRRRGLARRVLDELEDEAFRRGFTRVYLVTGPRQPEARGLYLAAGYRPLFDVAADPEEIGPLSFEKYL